MRYDILFICSFLSDAVFSSISLNELGRAVWEER